MSFSANSMKRPTKPLNMNIEIQFPVLKAQVVLKQPGTVVFS